MGLLPSSTLIHGIQKFLTTVLEEKTNARRRTHVIKSLYLAENMQVQSHDCHIYALIVHPRALHRFQELEYASNLLILLSTKQHSARFVKRKWGLGE